MANPTDFEQTIQSAVEKHCASLREALTAELGQLMAPAARGAGTAAVHAAFRRIVAAATQTAILGTLLDAASSFSPRAAILVAKGDKLIGWRGRGFDPATELRTFSLAAGEQGDWKDTIGESRQREAEVAPAPEAIAQRFFSAFGAPADSRAYLLPLTVNERVVAVLYADCGGQSGTTDLHALDLLTAITGMHLEIWAGRPRAAATAAGVAPPAEAPATPEAALVEAAPVEAAPLPAGGVPDMAADAAVSAPLGSEPVAALSVEPEPAPAPVAAPRLVTGPDLANIPDRDHDAHKKAFRFAKLLVDDLILYNKDRVEQGRAQRDLYSILKDDIDKSRAAYQKKWGSAPAGTVDYFHHLLVARVALGDPALLGAEYPGPLV